MITKFDSVAASKLIEEMNKYCQAVYQDANHLMDILEFSGKWDDDQMLEYRDKIHEIGKDITDSIRLQMEYKSIYEERVKELQG